MKDKILEMYAEKYSSSPIDISEEEISVLIANDCACDYCSVSILEIDDFPEIKDASVICEDCYDEHFMTTCPVCEERYEKEYESDYIVVTKELEKKCRTPIGIYKILQYPFYYGDIVFGFTGFFDNCIKRVSSININEYKQIRCGKVYNGVISGIICTDCSEKYLNSGNLITRKDYPAILSNHNRNYFKEYSDEDLHKIRQRIILDRIQMRALIKQHIL